MIVLRSSAFEDGQEIPQKHGRTNRDWKVESGKGYG